MGDTACGDVINRVCQNQHPETCGEDTLFVHMGMPANWIIGLGAYAEYWVAALTYALNAGRVLVIDTHPGWVWTEGMCESGTVACLFKPPGICNEADFGPHWGQAQHWVRASAAQGHEKVVWFDPLPCQPEWDGEANTVARCVEASAVNSLYMVEHLDTLYNPDADLGCVGSKIWLQGVMLAYLMRPQPVLERAISEARIRLWGEQQGPEISMHVRLTDKVEGSIAEAQRVSLATYVSSANAMAGGKDARLFLATDSATVYDVVAKGFGGEVLFDEARVRDERGDVLAAQGNGTTPEQRNTEIIAAAMDMALLSEASYYVGTFSSFFTRSAVKLLVARHAHLKLPGWFETDVVSVDADPWGSWPRGFNYQQ